MSMKKVKVNTTERKGRPISGADILKTANDLASTKNTTVDEIREYDNGAIGVFFSNGQFRFIKGTTKANLNIVRKSPRGSRKISPKSAIRAFNKYYNSRNYKSPKLRAAAMERDKCHTKSPKHITDLSKYKRSPRKYDYPGLDDGSSCSRKKISPTSPSNIDKALATIGRKRRTTTGGSLKNKKPVSLKTAVRLLRQYYAERYQSK